MARRLTLLRDETVAGTRGMIKPNILQAIMERERDAMLDHVNMLATGPLGTGHASDIDQVESDLIVGWAYRLVEIFGTRHRLDDHGQDELRAWLTEKGAPKLLVDAIVAQYPELRQEYQPSPKFSEIDPLVNEFELEGTPVTRQSLIRAVCRGRADALLNIDYRYPAIASAKVAELLERPLVARNDVISTEPYNKADLSEDNHTAEVSIASNGPDGSDTPDLTVEDLLAEVFAAWKSKNAIKVSKSEADPSRPEAFRQHRQTTLLLQRVLEHLDVHSIGQIRQWHVRNFRQLLDEVYRHWGRGLRHDQPYPTVAELHAQAAECKKAGKQIGLDTTTIRRHMTTLGQIFGFLRGAGYAVPTIDTQSLTPDKKQTDDDDEFISADDEGTKLSPSEAAAFTSLPLYTGCAGPSRTELTQPGSLVFHSGLYWVPLIIVYCGARRSEIAALEVGDIRVKNGIPHISIRRITEGKRGRGLKNKASKRLIPLHSELIRLGLLQYVDAIRKLGFKKLFPDLENPNSKSDDMGANLYRALMKLVDAHDENHPDDLLARPRFIHEIRHAFNNAIKQQGVHLEHRSELLGQVVEGVNAKVYSDPSRLPQKREWVEKFPAVTTHLEPADLRLLPNVIVRSRSRNRAPRA